MSVALHRNRALSRQSLDLSRFEPIVPQARLTVDELLKRGASLVRVTPHAVILRRARQLATVDQVGRVRWAA